MQTPSLTTQPPALLDSFGCPVSIAEIAVFRTGWRTAAQPAMQATPRAAAQGGALARCTRARPCTTARCPFEVCEAYLKLLVHGVVLKFLMAPTAERVVVPLKGFDPT